MKSMTDRKMDMNKGAVDSDGFFPEAPHHKKMPRAGEIGSPKYPDTEEAIFKDQQSFVKDANKAKARPDYRH